MGLLVQYPLREGNVQVSHSLGPGAVGAFLDIRDEFPEIMDFKINKIEKYKSIGLTVSKGLRKLGTWTNFIF